MSLFTFLRTKFQPMDKNQENQETRNQDSENQPLKATRNTVTAQSEQEIVKLKLDLKELFANGGTPAEQEQIIQRLDDLSCQISNQVKNSK